MLNDYLSDYAAKHGFRHYTELRAQRNSDRRVVFLNGNMIGNSSSSAGGVNARIYKSGSYGFASNPSYSNEGIEDVLSAAERNALFLAEKEKLGAPQFTKTPEYKCPMYYTKSETVEQKQIIEYLSAIDSYISTKYPGLTSRYVGSSNLNMEKLLLTSDNVYSHSFTPRAVIYIQMTQIDKTGTPIDLMEVFGDFGQFDEVFKKPEELYEKIDLLYMNLQEKCEGVYPEPGLKQCIMHPDLAGILAHEAVGHTVEADFVRSGSVGGPYLHKRVASDIVTLTDFAHHALGHQTPVPVYVDDEGTVAEDVVLIENGTLVNYMHNKESALYYNMKPTGNARAFSFSDEPLIRMRNTAILPGKDKLADMIASIDDGYYLVKTGNGQADATGEFMFGVNFGYEIKKGKITRAIKDTTISGVAFEMLKTVDMLSDDMVWACSGMCGKKQLIPVGMGGPAIKCKVNIGGR